MKKPFKINKHNEDVSRLLYLHTGMELATALTPSRRAHQGEKPTVRSCTWAGSRLEKVLEYGAQVTHRPNTNNWRISSKGLTYP